MGREMNVFGHDLAVYIYARGVWGVELPWASNRTKHCQ